MKFDRNRFAKLAGLPQTRGNLNESRKRALLKKRAENLKESRRGRQRRREEEILGYSEYDSELETDRHSDDYIDLDLDMEELIDNAQMSHDSQISREGEMDYDPMDDMGMIGLEPMSSAISDTHDDIRGYYGDDDPADLEPYDLMETDGDNSEEDADEMIDIDDEELLNEVRNIKRKRVNEARLKAVIEDELKDILSEMQYGSDWMYGDKKPEAPKKGSVTRGFTGIGFK
tara:strand:- start:175 stop:864 length:690 start_codon:yes stop_codon:yes gene_type:complete